ncbi:MAG: S1 family peptidase [Anaerolineae bacterium]|nr:S1 family peptidase [Anaerolineae bacterium]MDK1081231.1 S1 family peptidase [Anaerolineae bacterium]
MHSQNQINLFAKKLWLITILLIILFIINACGGAAPELVATEEPIQVPPAIYDTDSRMEPFEHTDIRLVEMANSVAVLVSEEKFFISGDTLSFTNRTLNEFFVDDTNTPIPMCTDELFASQINPGYCTGFLISEDTLVTAGHCVTGPAPSCSNMNVIFGFHMNSENSLANLSTDNLYKCEEIISISEEFDYAIIKLNRPTGISGLIYETRDHLQQADPVSVIGHPSGLPLKIASNSFVLSNNFDQPKFIANLDTFRGNSGSPVINSDTYLVEGILVGGTYPDYFYSDTAGCYQVVQCAGIPSGDYCTGEIVTKMSVLSEFLPEQTLSTSVTPAADSGTEPVGELNCFSSVLMVFLFTGLVWRKSFL